MFLKSPNSHQMLGLLLSEILIRRSIKNRPIWSHIWKAFVVRREKDVFLSALSKTCLGEQGENPSLTTFWPVCLTALETRKSHYSKTSRGGQYYKLSLFTTRTKSYTISILNHKMNRKLRSFKVDKIVVPSWIRLHLPSCHPGFEYQAHHLCFLLSKFVLYLSLCWEKGRNNKEKEAWFGPFFKKKTIG